MAGTTEAPEVLRVALSEEVMKLHESRSHEEDPEVSCDSNDRIASWIARLGKPVMELSDTSNHDEDFLFPVYDLQPHTSTSRPHTSVTGMDCSTANYLDHNIPSVLTVDGDDEYGAYDLDGERKREHQRSSKKIIAMMHEYEQNTMNTRGRYLGSKIDKQQALSKISIFDVQDKNSASSFTLVKSAIMCAAQRTALGNATDTFKGLHSRIKPKAATDSLGLSATDLDQRQPSWKALVDVIQEKEREIDGKDFPLPGSSSEEEGKPDTKSINLTGLVKLRMLSKKAKTKASQNSPRSYAISRAHEKFIKTHGEDIKCGLPMTTKLMIYDFALPILQDTVKTYKKKLGESHLLTQEAIKQLDKVQLLNSERSIFFQKVERDGGLT